MSLLSASPILFHSWGLSPDAYTNPSHSGRFFFHRIPHSTVVSSKCFIKIQPSTPTWLFQQRSAGGLTRPGQVAIPVWNDSFHTALLESGQDQRRKHRNSENNKYNNRYLGRGAGGMWSRSANIQTTQKQFRGAFWSIHTLEVPRTSFILAAWPLTQIRFLKREKEISLPFSRDYMHLCRAASQQQHNIVHICLGDLSFSFWLPRKHDSQMKGHFTKLTAYVGGNSKLLCRAVVSNRKLPKPKCYVL